MKKRQTIDVGTTMKIDAYYVLTGAVAAGVEYGWRRAHKYADEPDEHEIRGAIYDAVMGELCEVLRFDDPVEDE